MKKSLIAVMLLLSIVMASAAFALTRYEAAQWLVLVDINRASREDVAILRKLILEFKDELLALSVDLTGLDNRLTVLVGGDLSTPARTPVQEDASVALPRKH